MAHTIVMKAVREVCAVGTQGAEPSILPGEEGHSWEREQHRQLGGLRTLA